MLTMLWYVSSSSGRSIVYHTWQGYNAQQRCSVAHDRGVVRHTWQGCSVTPWQGCSVTHGRGVVSHVAGV